MDYNADSANLLAMMKYYKFAFVAFDLQSKSQSAGFASVSEATIEVMAVEVLYL